MKLKLRFIDFSLKRFVDGFRVGKMFTKTEINFLSDVVMSCNFQERTAWGLWTSESVRWRIWRKKIYTWGPLRQKLWYDVTVMFWIIYQATTKHKYKKKKHCEWTTFVVQCRNLMANQKADSLWYSRNYTVESLLVALELIPARLSNNDWTSRR